MPIIHTFWRACPIAVLFLHWSITNDLKRLSKQRVKCLVRVKVDGICNRLNLSAKRGLCFFIEKNDPVFLLEKRCCHWNDHIVFFFGKWLSIFHEKRQSFYWRKWLSFPWRTILVSFTKKNGLVFMKNR